MRGSTGSRGGTRSVQSKRILAALGTLTVFAAVATVAQMSSAQTRSGRAPAATTAANCTPVNAVPGPPNGRGTTKTTQNGREVRNHWGDGDNPAAKCASTLAGPAANTKAEGSSIECPSVADKLGNVPAQAKAEVDRNLALLETQITEAEKRLAADGKNGEGFINNAILGPLASKRGATIDRMAIAISRVAARPNGLNNLAQCKVSTRAGENNNNNQNGNNNNNNNNNNGGNNNNNNQNNGLQILGDTCANSRLQEHDGFQRGNRCATTQFGEVPSAAKGASLLITEAPQSVRVGQAFSLTVSTRNLDRDRFLGAAAGGYYLESSFLNEQGLVRGHFHTACRMLQSTDEAPDPAPAPAFFVATEDGSGSEDPDEVTIQVTGMPSRGTAQCASWAGDGSHRIPMMERANQTPAFDVVKIRVT